jgi:organic radical activating enzyme
VVDRIIDADADGQVKVITITGGEPLLHSHFLKCLLPPLRDKAYKIHLDTNGTMPDKLNDVIDSVDVVAMDIKLPSSTKDRHFWEEHLAFLKVARAKGVFVKMVITNDTREEDIDKAVGLIEGVDSAIALILQPASEFGEFKGKPDNARVMEWQKRAQAKLKDVRVMPQLHRIKGIR